MSCISKNNIGNKLKSRSIENQKIGSKVAVNIINRMTNQLFPLNFLLKSQKSAILLQKLYENHFFEDGRFSALQSPAGIADDKSWNALF
jgi:hypothetical protein